jgi:hypothetical protein
VLRAESLNVLERMSTPFAVPAHGLVPAATAKPAARATMKRCERETECILEARTIGWMQVGIAPTLWFLYSFGWPALDYEDKESLGELWPPSFASRRSNTNCYAGHRFPGNMFQRIALRVSYRACGSLHSICAPSQVEMGVRRKTFSSQKSQVSPRAHANRRPSLRHRASAAGPFFICALVQRVLGGLLLISLFLCVQDEL